MGIYVKGDPSAHESLVEEIEPQNCYYCGSNLFEDSEKSIGGVVYWMGASGVIALHQPCATLLGVHFIQDARSLSSKVGCIAKISHEQPKEETSWFVQNKNDN